MNVLVTGGAGFIGSHLVELLHEQARVRVLDNLRTGHRRNLEGLRCDLIEGSILDPDAVARSVDGVDFVFHLAALTSVPQSVERPHECVAINVTGTLNVLEAAARAGVKKLCFCSSAAVYGDAPGVPKWEDMRPAPTSPYAVSKLDGEYYCQQYDAAGRLPTVALRFFNVFGPRQDPAGPYAAAVTRFLHQALRDEPITIHGDGLQTRDFIYVKDIVAALAFVAWTSDLRGVFNIGYGSSVTILDLAQQILALTGSHSSIRFAPPRPGDVRHSLAAVEKLRTAGYRPAGSLERGLAETIAAVRAATVPSSS